MKVSREQLKTIERREKRRAKAIQASAALDFSIALRRAAANYSAVLLIGSPIRKEWQAIDALDKAAIVYTDAVRKRRG